jgi:hypothetical protein
MLTGRPPGASGETYPSMPGSEIHRLLWNTEGIPTLKIPPYKVDKSLALIDFALSKCDSLSRLCLAVIKGVLESLVDATPSRTGHTHLRTLEITLHPPGWEETYLPYYSFTTLSDKNVKDLQWWHRCLSANYGRQSRAARAEILIPSFGDGSGTGTGGTVQYYRSMPMERWKAVWDAPIMRMNRSSNWKEVSTLRLTLQRAAKLDRHVLTDVPSFILRTISSPTSA